MIPSSNAGREVCALAQWEAESGHHLLASTEAGRWISDHPESYRAIVDTYRAAARPATSNAR